MTAVEFLVKGLPMVYWEDPYYSDLLEQAKLMEKQQIINACNSNFTYGNNGYPTLGEIYYKETYNLSQQDKP